MRLLGALIVLCVCAFTVACDSLSCAAVALPAVQVEVRDSITGVAAARGATGVIQDNSFHEQLNAISDLLLVGGYDRAGTYTVVVSKVGYEVWTTTGVRVTNARCSINTATISARLVPKSN